MGDMTGSMRGRTQDSAITVGIDLGGTGIRLVALDETGVVRAERTTRTPHRSTSDDLAVRDLIEEIGTVAAGLTISAVGIGASGPVDQDGVIRNEDTLAAFSHLPLTEIVSTEFDVPCFIDNDAVTAAIGENAYGAGGNTRSLLMVTLGTGIGAALLVDNQPVRAADGSHPEAGHLPVSGASAPCYCGLPVCWEQLASRTALNQLTSDRTPELAVQAGNGDVVAETVFDVYGDRVGAGLAILLPLIRPERLVLGGSAAQYLPLYSSALAESLRRAPGFSHHLTPLPATLGALSGAIGAAVLARQADRVRSRRAGEVWA